MSVVGANIFLVAACGSPGGSRSGATGAILPLPQQQRTMPAYDNSKDGDILSYMSRHGAFKPPLADVVRYVCERLPAGPSFRDETPENTKSKVDR